MRIALLHCILFVMSLLNMDAQERTIYSEQIIDSTYPKNPEMRFLGITDTLSQEFYITKFDTSGAENKRLSFRYNLQLYRGKVVRYKELSMDRIAICTPCDSLIKEYDECGVPYLAKRYIVQKGLCVIALHISIYFDRMKIYTTNDCYSRYDPVLPIESVVTLRRAW